MKYMVFDRELNLDKCDERLVEDIKIKKRVPCYHRAGTKHQHCNNPVISSVSFWENLAITF